MPGVQSTDAENSKPLKTSTSVEDDVKTTMSKSAQAIAQERENRGGVNAGQTGENPGASITKNVANNA
jgi:hypothetical protein